MKIEQIYTGCLAQGAYYIESQGQAAIIDPLRQVDPYLQKAARDQARIRYLLETHFHADFVSGHLDLSRKTGATIVFGPCANPSFAAHIAVDGEELVLGDSKIRILHTPGHTLESCCYLVIDETGKPNALFSGDTLFIGDVGRPDLAQKATGITIEQMTTLLFRSLAARIMPLPDDVLIYPAHGAGSACGKHMSRDTVDTLGHQKAVNYALQKGLTEEEFVKKTTERLRPPPAYFPLNVKLNRTGYENLDQVMDRAAHAFSPDAFEAAANETGSLILDTRDGEIFASDYIPNSINIGVDGNFAPWAGTLIADSRQKILIVADPGREEEAAIRLARAGLDQSIGYLAGGFRAWKAAGKETDTIPSLSAPELATKRAGEAAILLDVRKRSEYDSEHIIGSVNAPLDYINDSMSLVKKDRIHYVYCAGGYRSMIFISILKARGYDKLVNVKEGFKAIKASGLFPLTEQVCPTTLL
ncbi:MAG TPA: MBL fold metallo-hydrolase [Puia sp.]|nr:MBL fold metallo-hydrolase [Puia sp.]